MAREGMQVLGVAVLYAAVSGGPKVLRGTTAGWDDELMAVKIAPESDPAAKFWIGAEDAELE